MKKKSFSDILGDISEAGLARMRRKAPEWADTPGVEFPTRLATEQCSSAATADYKSALVRRIRPGCRLLLDLTGGLGVDCAAFSKVSERVAYNEMDPVLEAAAERNFARLGISNVSFSCVEATEETLPALTAEGPDIIFLDPARRNGSGRKVFLLEDCSPDVLRLKAGLLAAAPDILVKLSPMADISMVCKRLGPEIRELHVVGADGECKEILAWLQRGWNGEATVVADGLRFTAKEEAEALPRLLPTPASIYNTTRNVTDNPVSGLSKENSPDVLSPNTFLFEPAPVLLKAGCFNLLCERLSLYKLGLSTHLYFTDSPSDIPSDIPSNTPSDIPSNILARYGKLFRITGLLPFSNSSIKALGKSLPRCGVTARNLPISSDSLASRLWPSAPKGARTTDDDAHIFAFTADFSDAPSQRLLAITRRL